MKLSQNQQSLIINSTLEILNMDTQGTGFFLAPDLVLTAYHVVSSLKNEIKDKDIVAKHFQKQENINLKVLDYYDELDIALLQTQNASDTCVMMEEKNENLLESKCIAWGYPISDISKGEFENFECMGLTGGNSKFVKFKKGNARRGYSGSPLINLDSGKVCGIIIARILDQHCLEGFAVPSSIIFDIFKNYNLKERHYKFHNNNPKWQNLFFKNDENNKNYEDNKKDKNNIGNINIKEIKNNGKVNIIGEINSDSVTFTM